MILVKNSRHSALPISTSTPYLPSRSSADFDPPSPRKSVGYSRKGKEKERRPPSSFSIGRALSFGRKKSRERMVMADSEPVDDFASTHAGLPSSYIYSGEPRSTSQDAEPPLLDRLNVASMSSAILLPHSPAPADKTHNEYTVSSRRRSMAPQRLKKQYEPAIFEGVVSTSPSATEYTGAEIYTYRPQPLHVVPVYASSTAISSVPLPCETPDIFGLERHPSAASVNSAYGSTTEESSIVRTPLGDSESDARRDSFGKLWDLANGGQLNATREEEIRDEYPPSKPLREDFSGARSSSPTASYTHSTATLQTTSSTSTARAPLQEIPPPARTSDPAGVDFDSPPCRPTVRIRSASLAGRSAVTTSVYSVGEILVATQGVISPVRAMHFGLDLTELHGTHATETLRRSFDGNRRAVEVDDPRSSMTLRRPPPPPHLATSTTVTASSATSPRPGLPSRSSSLSQLWRRLSSSSKGKREAPVPPRRRSSLFPTEDAPQVPPPVSPVDIQRLMDKASRGKTLQSQGKENIPVPSASNIAARNSSLAELPLAAAPISPTRARDETQSRPVLIESPESLRSATREKRRKYRQTLVEIKDDAVFQRVLQDLAQLQSDEVLEMRRTKSSAKREDIGAWFVTREMVQGERRHGRLLARGVMIVRGVEPRRRRGSSYSGSPRFGVLLEHLPRLLAVSLTLSSRFEHDPSPTGVALAFEAMESELVREIGFWAGELGHLIATGMIDEVGKSPGSSRQGSVGDLNDDPDERLGFADIVMAPITRALRYKLLFTELLHRLPIDSRARDRIESALLAANRLAAECDKRQMLDLDDLRRTGRSVSFVESKIGKKKRAKSMGPGGIREH